MDIKQSILHLVEIQKQSLEKDFENIWNLWAQELMDERGWDAKKHRYTKEITEEWNERANLTFNADSFSPNVVHTNNPFKLKMGEEGINFKDCIFPGHLKINQGQVEMNCSFEGAKFLDGATFKNIQFTKNTNFSKTESYSDISFRESEFSEPVNFQDFILKNGEADFSSMKCMKEAKFKYAIFDGPVDFSGCIFDHITEFQFSKFHDEVSFQAIHSKRSFNMMNVYFRDIPDFTSYRFDHLPYVYGTQIKEFTIHDLLNRPQALKIDPATEISRAQALKAMAIQSHDYDREIEFFSHELTLKAYQSLKGDDKEDKKTAYESCRSQIEVIPYYLYFQFSNYGRSVFRPFLWWVLFNVVIWLLYLFKDFCHWGKSLYLSFLHGLPVFGLWRTENHKTAVETVFGKEAYGWDVIFVIQNLISTLLLFLFLQAIRNKFKIK